MKHISAASPVAARASRTVALRKPRSPRSFSVAAKFGQVMPRVNTKNLRKFALTHCSPATRFMTDEFSADRGVGEEFLSPGAVSHRAGEYVSGVNHNNPAESCFALLNRGHYGTFHHFSKHQLQRSVNELQFRWNHRKVNDGLRRKAALRCAGGKRPTDRESNDRRRVSALSRDENSKATSKINDPFPSRALI